MTGNDDSRDFEETNVILTKDQLEREATRNYSELLNDRVIVKEDAEILDRMEELANELRIEQEKCKSPHSGLTDEARAYRDSAERIENLIAEYRGDTSY